MAKTPPITNVTSGFSSTIALNNNFTSLRDGFDNTLSLDGSTPNAMQTELDLANNNIINVGSVETDTLLLGGVLMTPSGVDPVYSGTISLFGASLIDDVDAAAGRTTLGLSTVAATGSYTDLSNQPSLNFASSAQGALADTALQAGDSLDAGDLVNALPAIDGSNLTGVGGIGTGQTWSEITRSANTSYQNTSGGPIQVSCYAFGDDQTTSSIPNANTMRFEVSTNGTTWVVAQHAFLERTGSGSSYGRSINSNIIIPNSNYYRLFSNGSISVIRMSELS